ncbi:hypothetical protein P3X46_032780 [Hevea brasiliensis]|uniref:Transmembrane protein n=1 Tax=Hevea brasiliensis TaxID=3981 RepID=A0ABQ9KHF4_HEVBR|nr:hypothetical protein P3X46_032780 [Hevea brasiliensis]
MAHRSIFFLIYIISLLVFFIFPSEMVLAKQVQVHKTKEQLKNFEESKIGPDGSVSPAGPHGEVPIGDLH